MQEPSTEIRDLEIFDAAGFPDFDVDQIARNFTRIARDTGEQIRPPLVIGHGDDQALLRDSGLPAAGWIQRLRAVGPRLLADVADVPRLVAQAIERKAYRRISAEIYTNYKGLGQALRRVALLGGAIPKVKTLQDVVALYSDDEPFETICTDLPADDAAQPHDDAPDDDGATPPPDDAPAAADDAASQPHDVAPDDDAAAAASQPHDNAPDDDAAAADAASQPHDDAPDQPHDDAPRRREVDRFCEQLCREGRYAPAWDELGLPEFLLSLDDQRATCFAEGGVEQTGRGWFEQFLRRLPTVVDFSEKAPAAAGPVDPDRRRLTDFYRQHRADFERLGVTLEMFLAAES